MLTYCWSLLMQPPITFPTILTRTIMPTTATATTTTTTTTTS